MQSINIRGVDIMKKALINIGAIILAIISFFIANRLITLLYQLAGKVPFLLTILSFPADSNLLIITGLATGTVAAGHVVYNTICKYSNSQSKVGLVCLVVIFILLIIIRSIFNILVGFHWNIIVYLVCGVGASLLMLSESD
jgi:hypothetical protein